MIGGFIFEMGKDKEKEKKNYTFYLCRFQVRYMNKLAMFTKALASKHDFELSTAKKSILF